VFLVQNKIIVLNFLELATRKKPIIMDIAHISRNLHKNANPRHQSYVFQLGDSGRCGTREGLWVQAQVGVVVQLHSHAECLQGVLHTFLPLH
jgi:hypothetical protein